MEENKSSIVYALKIALPYVVAGWIWILFSDRLLEHYVHDAETLTILQTYKGFTYVLLSALLVYVTARRYISSLLKAQSRLNESRSALSESQRAMLTLLRNISGMAYRRRCSGDWTMEFVSEGCLGLTGYLPEDIIDDAEARYRELIMPEDRDRVRERVEQAIAGKSPFQLEYRIRTKDGKQKWVWEQGCGVYSVTGYVQAVEGYMVDITEEKELQERLKATERLSLIGQAASTIIHDLKNPMQVILGHIELLRNGTKPGNIERHYDIIEKQVRSILSMSRELLEYARGEISLELEETDVSELLEQLVETYRPSFEQAGVTLSHTSRRESAASTKFELDRDRVWRVMMNVINNAKEALSGSGQIRIRSWIAPEQVRIEVQDDGPGIPDEIQATLFEPFVTHGKSGGTGLGLAIARRIVEAHRGAISFTSSHETGTTFTISLPRRRQAQRVAGAASDAAPRAAVPGSFGSPAM